MIIYIYFCSRNRVDTASRSLHEANWILLCTKTVYLAFLREKKINAWCFQHSLIKKRNKINIIPPVRFLLHLFILCQCTLLLEISFQTCQFYLIFEARPNNSTDPQNLCCVLTFGHPPFKIQDSDLFCLFIFVCLFFSLPGY